jgi:hypothetical protein
VATSKRRARTAAKTTHSTVTAGKLQDIAERARSSAFNVRDMIGQAVAEQVREALAIERQSVTMGGGSIAVATVVGAPSRQAPSEPNGEMDYLADRLESAREALIERCGRLSVALERINGRTITPSVPPSAGNAPSGQPSKMQRMHDSIDSINLFLSMLDELASAVAQL